MEKERELKFTYFLALMFLLPNGLSTSAEATKLSSTCCSDGLGLNYTLPMFDECKLKQHQDGSMIQTIPKLIPASSAEATQCRRKSKLGIPPGRRVCRFPDCFGTPCINGWCEETMTGYQCHCPVGYSGKQCKNMKDGGPRANEPVHSMTTQEPRTNTSSARIPTSTRVDTLSTPLLTASNSTPSVADSYESEIFQSESETFDNTEPQNGINCTLLNANASCPDGWSAGLAKCYHFDNGRRHNWKDSVSSCEELQSLKIGGVMRYPSLWVPESIEDVHILRRCIFPHVEYKNYWINCKRDSSSTHFVCATTRAGNTTNYRNWGSQQPNDNANQACSITAMKREHKWLNVRCSGKRYYLCQIHI